MTYKVFRHGSWNYYSIDRKEIVSIAFFNQDGIVVQTEQGWLQRGDPKYTYREDLASISLEKEPVRKLKTDFQGMFAKKQPFYVYGKFVSHRCHCHKEGYILFIPFITDDWRVTTENIDHATTREEYTIYVHKKEGYIIYVPNGSTLIEDNITFIRNVRELFKLAVYSDNAISDISIIENRAKIIELIRDFPTNSVNVSENK
jgi:hypothetical protein